MPPHDRSDDRPHQNWWQRIRAESQRESPALEEGQDNPGERTSYSRSPQEQEPVDRTRSPSPTEAQGKASYGGTKGQGTPLGSAHGRDLVGQCAIDSECR